MTSQIWRKAKSKRDVSYFHPIGVHHSVPLQPVGRLRIHTDQVGAITVRFG